MSKILVYTPVLLKLLHSILPPSGGSGRGFFITSPSHHLTTSPSLREGRGGSLPPSGGLGRGFLRSQSPSLGRVGEGLSLHKVFSSVFALALCLFAGSSFAQKNITAEWVDSTALRLGFVLSENADAGSDYSVYAVPRIASAGGDTLLLEPTIFRGKRNMRYTERARFYKTAAPATTGEVPVGTDRQYNVELKRSDYPWLWDGALSLDVKREKDGCCTVEDMPAKELGHIIYIPEFRPLLPFVPDFTGRAGELQKDNPVLQHISKYVPYTDKRVLRKEKGALVVHFELAKSNLLPGFRNNAPTLDRIVSITRDIMADTTSSVKVIQIIGLASVEGPYNTNRKLAGGRAEALKNYIRSKVSVPEQVFECVNGGEAWAELRDQIADSDMEGRDRLLSIIDNVADADRREAEIKKLDGGKPYAYVKEHMLGEQRNSGYIRIYYDYVPDKAAAVINNAIDLMSQGKYAEALAQLKTVSTDKRSGNALGVAYYMTGDTPNAIDTLRRAAADGSPEAKVNLEKIEDIERRK